MRTTIDTTLSSGYVLTPDDPMPSVAVSRESVPMEEFCERMRTLEAIGVANLVIGDVRRDAERIAQMGMQLGLPCPSPVPTGNGGIQVEWHAGPVSVEITARPDGMLDLFAIDQRSDEEEEAEAIVDLRRVRPWLIRLKAAIPS